MEQDRRHKGSAEASRGHYTGEVGALPCGASSGGSEYTTNGQETENARGQEGSRREGQAGGTTVRMWSSRGQV